MRLDVLVGVESVDLEQFVAGRLLLNETSERPQYRGGLLRVVLKRLGKHSMGLFGTKH